MSDWKPLTLDAAKTEVLRLSEISTLSYESGDRYAISYYHYDDPENRHQLESVDSVAEAENLHFWIMAEELLCLMGAKREPAEAAAYEFRDAIARGESPTMDDVATRGRSIKDMLLHPESPLRSEVVVNE